MSDVSLLPAPRLSAGIESQLRERTEQRLLSPARQRGYELRLVGATVLPQRQVITCTPHGTWLFVDHVEDPTALEYRGRIPVPIDQLARLRALDQAGVRPDLVWLGHELPADWQEDDPLPQLVPAPRHLREKDQRLTQRLRTGTELLLKGAGATLAVAAAAPLAVAGTILAAGAGLDPIVLGGVRHPEAPVVQWVLLAQWEWE